MSDLLTPLASTGLFSSLRASQKLCFLSNTNTIRYLETSITNNRYQMSRKMCSRLRRSGSYFFPVPPLSTETTLQPPDLGWAHQIPTPQNHPLEASFNAPIRYFTPDGTKKLTKKIKVGPASSRFYSRSLERLQHIPLDCSAYIPNGYSSLSVIAYFQKHKPEREKTSGYVMEDTPSQGRSSQPCPG